MLQRTIKLKIVKFLPLLFTLLILGCSHQKINKEEERFQVLEEMREHIQSISDPERVGLLLELMDIIKQDMNALNRSIQTFGAASKVLFSDYDATPEDFDKLFSEFNKTRIKLQQKILTSYFKMKELTSPEEWEDIAKFEEKAFFDGPGQTLLDSQI